MPLSFALIGQENIIKSITGKDEIKKHLANLGFVVGLIVSICIIILAIYMLFRPYKEATVLEEKN